LLVVGLEHLHLMGQWMLVCVVGMKTKSDEASDGKARAAACHAQTQRLLEHLLAPAVHRELHHPFLLS
jgi:hypothetical protein